MKVFNFDNTFLKLPDILFEHKNPDRAPEPHCLLWNQKLAENLGLILPQPLPLETLTPYFTGQKLFEGAVPIALAYAGHQFGNFVPQLGDGRAVLLGEHITPNGARLDIQLKGSGATRFSRRGDGKSALGPALREYIISEAFHYLKIPSTRTLGVYSTGETVYRETPLPGGLSVRVAASHIRVGSFEYLVARGDFETLKTLVHYAIQRHDPELLQKEFCVEMVIEFLKKVVRRQARLVAKWMSVGFIHGVMNTDNTLVSGETIDFGPCAFMDIYHPETVFSSIDRWGRYAYQFQPQIMKWNLARLGEALVFCWPDDLRANALLEIKDRIESFNLFYEEYWFAEFANKFGFKLQTQNINDETDKTLTTSPPELLKLFQDFLNLLETNKLDFTMAFIELEKFLKSPNIKLNTPWSCLADSTHGPAWLDRWIHALQTHSTKKEESLHIMAHSNPALIPRNHWVEKMLREAVEHQKLENLQSYCEQLQTPFDRKHLGQEYCEPPPQPDSNYRTFCGT